MRDELDYPSRDLRLNAQVAQCKDEVLQICQWLRREIERAIDTETMFD
jgi:hypothetical protein